jgi:hypothetical protein
MPHYFKKIGCHIATKKSEIIHSFSLAFGTGRLYRNCEDVGGGSFTMKKVPFNADVLGTVAGVITFLIVVVALFYLLAWGPFDSRHGFRTEFRDRNHSERLDERCFPGPWRQIRRMWRNRYPGMFDEQLWEDLRNDWEDRGREFDRDFWEWMERKLEEYMEDEAETEKI